MEEAGAVTEAEAVSVAGVASTTTCMEASMDICHKLLKTLLWSRAPQKVLRLMLRRAPRLCVKVCPIVASTVGADTREAGTPIPHLLLNLSPFLHNPPNLKENAVSHLLTTTASVADRLHIQGQVRTAASVSTVSSRKTAKHELADAKDAAVTRENTMMSPSTLTERKTLSDPTPAMKTHLEDHAVAEETERSTVQLAKTAETAIIAVVAAGPRITVPPMTINPLAPRAAATVTVKEKRNARIATGATVIASALAEIAQPPPMALLTIILHAAHVAKNQLPLPTTKVSRSRALAQAPNLLPHPPAPATLATRTEAIDDPVLPLSPCPKITPPAPLPTLMPRNAKLVSKNVWPKNSRDVKALPWGRETEVVSKGDEARMLEVRAREEVRVGRLVIGTKMRKARKLGLRELKGRGSQQDGGETCWAEKGSVR